MDMMMRNLIVARAVDLNHVDARPALHRHGAGANGGMMRGRVRGERCTRVLLSLLVVAGWIGLGQVPADATPASRADDVPVPEETAPFVAELVDFGGLRNDLRARYPDTFAGLINNGDDSLTIYETRVNATMHDGVRQRFDQVSRQAVGDALLAPRVTWRTVAAGGLSLNALWDLKTSIEGSREKLAGLGVGLEAVGIRDSANAVIVGVNTPTPQAQEVLERLFGKGHIQVIEWKLTKEADRFNDTAPWNGGDQIVTEGTSPGACTTGFGMHDGSGNHYLTTAGHCGTHFWWNTWVGFPIRDGSTFLGVTTGTVWDGVYSGIRVDTQKITVTGSSNIVWTGTATRRFITGAVTPAQDEPTCIEGSINLTQCGTIWGIDFGEGGSQYLVDLDGGITSFGDSGAPSWRTDETFGPLAQGTHVGSLTNGLRVEQNIYAVMFFNGLAINTTSDP